MDKKYKRDIARRHILLHFRNSRNTVDLNCKFYDKATAAYFLGFESKSLYDYVHYRYAIARTLTYNDYRLLNYWILHYSAAKLEEIKKKGGASV